jgi:site-specific DNA-methyltransferase (adenine-specific)
MKPYYEQDGITIYHGDCKGLLSLVPPVELVLTDPPHGVVNRDSGGLRSLDKGAADMETLSPAEIVSLLAPLIRGSAYIWCGTEQVSGLRSTLVDVGLTTRLGVWLKTNPSPMNGQYLWLSALEVCVFARRKGATFNEFCKAPFWSGPRASTKDHPTAKPLWLMERLILASSEPGSTVLDPFMGSGSTLVAAKMKGRKAIGVEIEEGYCQTAAERVARAVLSD